MNNDFQTVYGVQIGDTWVGAGMPCYTVGEIGINANGSVDIAKKLLRMIKECGGSAAKFQTRTIEQVYTKDELDKYRESPFGTTNEALKRGLEFDVEQYREIDAYCKEINLTWFTSCWDLDSVDRMAEFNLPCWKVASAMLTDDALLRKYKEFGKPVILSTGMSTRQEIDRAVDILGTDKLILLHCVSTYPSEPEEVNLRVMDMMRRRYGCVVGYSAHDHGIQIATAARALGAAMVEAHVTLSRSMYGSDQSSSLEKEGFYRLCRDIEVIDLAMGSPEKQVQEREFPIKAKLRRVG